MTRRAPAATTFIALACLLAAPAARSQAPAARPAPGGAQAQPSQAQLSREWKRLPGPNLTIVSNASPKAIAGLAAQIDTFFGVLQEITPSLKVTSPVPTCVVALKDRVAYTRLQPRDPRGRIKRKAAGYFSPSPAGNYLVTSWGGSTDESLQVLLHELTHYVLSRNLTTVPLWLNEGFAMFYMTFRINEGRQLAIVGEPPRGYIGVLSRRRLMRLDRLLTVRPSDRLLDNDDDRALFYAQSWAFIHYVMLGRESGPENPATAYVRALESGELPEGAFARAFGGSYEAVGSQLADYVSRSLYPVAGLKIARGSAAAPDPSRVQPMTEADAEAFQAGLLWRIGAVDEAEAALRRSVALQPESLAARVLSDRMRWSRGGFEEEAARYSELAALVSRRAAAEPPDAATSLHLSLAALAAGREAESDAELKEAMGSFPHPDFYRERAYAAFAFGRDDVAARDAGAYFRAPVWSSEDAPYMALLGALALRRLQQPGEAGRLLDKAAAAVTAGTWTAKVLDCMSGRLPAAALLAAASDDGERTEAHTYVGFDDALAGRRDSAIAHFRWVKDKGSRSSVEYPMATAELMRLEKAP